MSRLTRRSYADFSDEEKVLFDKIAKGRQGVADGHIGGPFDVWVLSPEMGDRLNGLGGMFRFRTAVNRRYIELAILMIGADWQAQFEWYAHEPMARQAGLPDHVIAAIKTGQMPVFDDAGDRLTYAVCHELLTQRHVNTATFTAAVELFGERGVAEIINVAGFYTMVCMSLNTFEVDLPEGAEYPFPRNQ